MQEFGDDSDMSMDRLDAQYAAHKKTQQNDETRSGLGKSEIQPGVLDESSVQHPAVRSVEKQLETMPRTRMDADCHPRKVARSRARPRRLAASQEIQTFSFSNVQSENEILRLAAAAGENWTTSAIPAISETKQVHVLLLVGFLSISRFGAEDDESKVESKLRWFPES